LPAKRTPADRRIVKDCESNFLCRQNKSREDAAKASAEVATASDYAEALSDIRICSYLRFGTDFTRQVGRPQAGVTPKPFCRAIGLVCVCRCSRPVTPKRSGSPLRLGRSNLRGSMMLPLQDSKPAVAVTTSSVRPRGPRRLAQGSGEALRIRGRARAGLPAISHIRDGFHGAARRPPGPEPPTGRRRGRPSRNRSASRRRSSRTTSAPATAS
jgi:hypothetical protein